MIPEFYRPPKFSTALDAAAKVCDRYGYTLKEQNEGKACDSCGSKSGHFAYCALLNHNTAEAQSVLRTGEFSVEDQHWLNAMERAFHEPDVDFETRQRG